MNKKLLATSAMVPLPGFWQPEAFNFQKDVSLT